MQENLESQSKRNLRSHYLCTQSLGSEFAEHGAISKALKAEFYFAHPYASWQRGLNENTNGLIRQYLQKGSDFNHVTDNELGMIMDRLNNRPRKRLGYATPDEVFYSHGLEINSQRLMVSEV